MNKTPLRFDAPLAALEEQASRLLAAFQSGDRDAAAAVHHHHPRFLDDVVRWKPKDMTLEQVLAAEFMLDDARLAVARFYSFRDWDALMAFAAAVADTGSPVHRFEEAVEAVVDGDAARLRQLIAEDPQLVQARSTRIEPHDPPVHRATLLHYVGANGVEGFRQRTPPNAVEIARILLDAGAEVDSLADLYGGKCATLTLLVSSSHPAQAGLQTALAELLIDRGASLVPCGEGNWINPLTTAMAFGYRETAEALARRGAPVDTLDVAAGLGRTADAARLLPGADAHSRHRALALAAQMGQADVMAMLLDAGEDPNRYNPDSLHAHSTPLHQAALAGYRDVVELLIRRGARLDIRDTLWNGTPLGWARHNGREDMEALLKSFGAPD